MSEAFFYPVYLGSPGLSQTHAEPITSPTFQSEILISSPLIAMNDMTPLYTQRELAQMTPPPPPNPPLPYRTHVATAPPLTFQPDLLFSPSLTIVGGTAALDVQIELTQTIPAPTPSPPTPQPTYLVSPQDLHPTYYPGGGASSSGVQRELTQVIPALMTPNSPTPQPTYLVSPQDLHPTYHPGGGASSSGVQREPTQVIPALMTPNPDPPALQPTNPPPQHISTLHDDPPAHIAHLRHAYFQRPEQSALSLQLQAIVASPWFRTSTHEPDYGSKKRSVFLAFLERKKTNGGPSYTCLFDNCGKELPRQDRALSHIRKHFKYRPFACTGLCAFFSSSSEPSSSSGRGGSAAAGVW